MERRIALGPGVSTILEQWGTRGPAILCIHGIAGSRRAWERLGELLGTSARVYAYDQRGHGDSATVSGPMDLARSVEDAAAVADAVTDRVDLLIGHSWGGAVAILSGRRVRARRVIAIDPMIRVVPGTFESEYVDDLRETLSLERGSREGAIKAMYAGAHPSDVAGKLHAMMPMTIGALERLGRENDVDTGGWNIRKSLENYPVPLDILAAGVDSVMSADDLRFAREQGGPNVTITTFENEGHNLQRSAFDRFAALVLERIDAGRARSR
jgi:pimeloyl-ACP methyl ester carboxylesterase